MSKSKLHASPEIEILVTCLQGGFPWALADVEIPLVVGPLIGFGKAATARYPMFGELRCGVGHNEVK